MKFVRMMVVTALILIYPCTAYAKPREGYDKIYGKYSKDTLTITSYSPNWDSKGLESIYKELLKNHISGEFKYLTNIYIYPDSPDNVRGNYFEDIRIYTNGTHMFGNNAYIELFNGASIKTAVEFAPVLSHEYGHHYTILNIMDYEGAYHAKWKDSEYAAIRGLKDYPVYYNLNEAGDMYHFWDVVEIAANDYVQLLASPNARRSYIYKDNLEILELNNTASHAIPLYFNAYPQENTVIPLAADVNGLYEYMIRIGGGEKEFSGIAARPVIKSISSESSFIYKRYDLEFEKAEGNGPFEYTIVMFPTDFPIEITAIKTLSESDELKAAFGTVVKEENGKYLAILDYYEGEYEIRVYAKDANGFIYASEPLYYDFGNIHSNLE